MPAPGEQHVNNTISNPFEEHKLRINESTAVQIATLQSRLDKQLGPEYISTRVGPGGGRVHYLAAEKVINLANEVFGFNGWSSSIQKSEIDFVDVVEGSNKVSLGMAVIVRVTLRDGTFHEDMGYGHIENCRGKAPAFEKARKEAVTDALKRALRNFGKVLGNCLYDKDYLAKVTRIKVPPAKWNEANLHRHPDFAPVKGGGAAEQRMNESGSETHSDRKSESQQSEVEDDFGGGNLFDGVELATSHKEPSEAPPPQDRNGLSGQINAPVAAPQARPSGPQRHVSMPATAQTLPRNQQAQPSRTATSSNVQARANALPQSDPPAQPNTNTTAPTTEQLNATGFVTSRNIASADEPLSDRQLLNLPRFNPAAESPSIKRTPGIDHSKSGRVERATIGAPPGPRALADQSNGQVQPQRLLAQHSVSTPAPPQASKPQATSPNFVNPAADPGRKIGMPAQRNGSPYRPPTGAGVKRPLPNDAGGGRPPLADVSNTATAKSAQGPGDGGVKSEKVEDAAVKRARVSGV